MRGIAGFVLIAAALAVLPPRLRADDASGPAGRQAQPAQSADDDTGLLEFLGGIGSEDDAWISYLAQTDPSKAAVAPPHAPAADGSRPEDPPAGSGKK